MFSRQIKGNPQLNDLTVSFRLLHCHLCDRSVCFSESAPTTMSYFHLKVFNNNSSNENFIIIIALKDRAKDAHLLIKKFLHTNYTKKSTSTIIFGLT